MRHVILLGTKKCHALLHLVVLLEINKSLNKTSHTLRDFGDTKLRQYESFKKIILSLL